MKFHFGLFKAKPIPMRKYFILALGLLLMKGTFAQNLYRLPENFKSSSISSFENINGIKGEGGGSESIGLLLVT